MMSAKLCVLAGGSVQVNRGESSEPSQVNFWGIVTPAENAVLTISKDTEPPFACGRKDAQNNTTKESGAANALANRDGADRLRVLLVVRMRATCQVIQVIRTHHESRRDPPNR